MNESFLTRKQVKEYFDISYPTLKRLIENGTIPAYRLSQRKTYFKESEIKSLLKPVLKV